MAEYFPIDVSSFGSYSGSFSGSFFGNGSRLTGITASFFSGSVTSASYAATASYLLGSIASASYALTASYVNPLVQNVIITGSTYLTDSIYFSGSGPASRLVWNETDGTLDLGLKGGNVTLQIGQEQVIQVVNKTGANLLEADYKAVRIRRVDEGGAQGQRLAIVLAQANNDANSVDTLGLVTEDIAVNQEGFITNSGLVRNIDTTGTLQGETWVDGDVLYLSPTTSGFITKVKPQAPQHTIVMGYVVYAHANNGKIFVKVDNGYELDELHNVKITTASLSSGDLLVYSSSVWVNTKQLTGSYGLTGSLQATSFTGSLLGTASNAVNALTASFINTASTNAFVQNGNSFGATALLGTNDNQSLAFETSGSTRMFISSSGNVGVGTITPNYGIHHVGTIGVAGIFSQRDFGFNAFSQISQRASFVAYTTDGSNGIGIGANGTAGLIQAFTGTIGSPSARILSLQNLGGNVSIGTTTDSARLTVRGSGATSATTALRVENTNASASLVVLDNGFVGIGTSSPAYLFDITGSDNLINISPQNSGNAIVINNNGYIKWENASLDTYMRCSNGFVLSDNGYNSKFSINFGGLSSINTGQNFSFQTGNVLIGTTTDAGFRLDVSGSARITNGLTVTGSQFTFVSGSSVEFRATGTGVSLGNIITDTHTITGSLNVSGSITSSLFGTASYATQALSASWAPSVASNPFPFTGSAIISGSLTITGSLNVSGSSIITNALTVGSSSLGPNENTITLGARDNGSEGGQIGFNAPGGTYTSASMIDLYQDRLRVLRGTNAGSVGEVAWWSMHNLQMALPAYNSPTVFTGSAVAGLGVDSNGNVVTSTRTGRYGTAISGSTIGTGVTAQTIVYSQLIPANSFVAGDVVRTYYRFRKLSTNANATHNILVNTTAAVAGATTLATLTANTVHNQIKRDFYIAQGNATTTVGAAINVATDDTTNTQLLSVINWAVDQYLIYTVTLNTLDSGHGLGYTIEQVL